MQTMAGMSASSSEAAMESLPSPVSSPSPSPSRSAGYSAQSRDRSSSQSDDEDKVLFMFFSFLQGPIAYRLYAVKVPDLSSFLRDKDNHYDPSRETRDIFPVLEFPSEKFPYGMSCVELDSKLYFLGGSFPSYDFVTVPEFPSDVRVLDTSRISMDTTMSCDLLLEECSAMKSGKPDACVFVAEKKIFVIMGPLQIYNPNETPRFEVFDPKSNQWTSLPDPPIQANIASHAVVDKIVYLVSADNELFSYNVHTCEWKDYPDIILPYEIFLGKAEFVDDTLYACSDKIPVAYRTISCAQEGSLFDEMVPLSSEIKAVHDSVSKPYMRPCLVHLGNRVFCYVCSDCIPGANNSKYFGIKLTFFQALSAGSDNHHGSTDFRARFLDFTHFVSKTDLYYLRDCFPQSCFSIS